MERSELHVSRHAMDRYRQRVADLSDREIFTRLTAPAVELAAGFGAPFVKLAGGQRIVLQGNSVVTVLPADQAIQLLGHRHGHGALNA